MHSESLDMIGGQLEASGLPAFIVYGVYLGEVLAPLMLIAGYYCRYGAILIVINMLFAVGLFHMGDIFSLSERSGSWRLELQGFYLFGALALMFFGSGKYALRPD
jgi:putative oxidoreductase